MEFVARLRRLWRIPGFRRLLSVRIVAQTADGISQMGVISFALFDPQRAANAWAVVMVLSITLLPFSIIGPFTGVLLDRWPRQRMVIVTESIRLVLCLAIAALIAWTAAGGAALATVYVLVLVVLSFNRFLLNGLGAGLADVVDKRDYLDASSIMPMLGPLGMVAGGVVAGSIRLALGEARATEANALIFVVAGAFCIATVAFASRIGRLEIGPLPEVDGAAPQTGSPAQIWHGLVDAWRYLRRRHPAMQGLGGVAVQHTMYGVLMTCIIMAYRNYFSPPGNPDAAVVPMGIWFGASGAGFVLSGIVAPWVGHRIGLRWAVTAFMLVSAVIQVAPGSIFVRPCLVVAAFIMGVCSQSVKVCADTLVQLHVSDDYRGRVFAGYDMLNNVTLVLGALIAALVAPPHGLSLPVFLGVAAVLGLEGVAFALLSRPWADDPRRASTPPAPAPQPVGVSAADVRPDGT